MVGVKNWKWESFMSGGDFLEIAFSHYALGVR